jgi:membrane-associated phospholipid phosphatase
VSRFRSSEYLILAYFGYVAAISPFFMRAAWRTYIVAGIVLGIVWLARQMRPVVRDFAPLAALFIAYREMDWFTPPTRDFHLERAWVIWDRLLLDQYGLRAAIESAGSLLPEFLELCYLLVYGVAPIALWALYANAKSTRVKHFWFAYLAGTLGAYALFPYFPSEPPRTAFPGLDMPTVVPFMRRVNMLITGGYGIHSSVFPSAHVSSAFSAGWALLGILREKRWIGWGFIIYGVCVAFATLYGRYHYGVDALAGFALSFVAIPALRFALMIAE